ncbi:D-isomer specific 2-hydroxyacid dehydrogenase family protein [Pseudactinotalea sp. HY158]|uniref:NAD(P)-dependent oxidoreductase n=1 Tax=Pseudactinotalea sp. HY158 TaxID=2654547 RepID=UPI0018921B81|nr:NAD(P)-dependent oxidoreductase [Pseudactinotalea sp. HY158]
MPLPVILSTSPRSIVEGPYQRRHASMSPHELRYSSRDPKQLARDLAEADLILGDWTAELKLDRHALDAANRSRIVVHPTAGYDSIDVTHAAALGLPVANTPGANARGVAEWAVMAALACLKNLTLNHQRTRAGEWRMVEASAEGVYDVGGRTIGILGFGAIGQGVARRLHAFGVDRILYFDAFVDVDSIDGGAPVERVQSVAELCERADVVSIHLPLTPETRHIVDAENLRRIGTDGVIVNTARGQVVDEDALHAALVAGTIKAAALDVFSDEPLIGAHRWADLENVLLSPHLAGSTHESKQQMLDGALRSLDAALRGDLPRSVVNQVTSLRLL